MRAPVPFLILSLACAGTSGGTEKGGTGKGGSDTAGDADSDSDADSDADTDTDPCPGADPFAELEPLDPDGPLCEIPEDWVEGGGDPANPPCAIAYGGASDRDFLDVPSELVLVDWNVRYGLESATVVDTLASLAPDIALLQEVTRLDLASDPPLVDQAEELAAALGMVYASGVEWDRRENEAEGGEHVVTVLSKYPLGNARLIRHTPLEDWWEEDARYGGRASLAVEARIGCEPVRFWSVHLDTRDYSGEGRAAQGAEIRADAEADGVATRQVAGGDFNTWLCNPSISDCNQAPDAEQVVEEFLEAGWSDAVPDFESYTQLGEGFFPQRLDWVFWRGGLASFGGEVLQDADGSDHFPTVWTFGLTE